MALFFQPGVFSTRHSGKLVPNRKCILAGWIRVAHDLVWYLESLFGQEAAAVGMPLREVVETYETAYQAVKSARL